MKLLLLNQHRMDVIGGSEIQCDLIARGLLDRGHDVHYGALDGRASDYGTPYATTPIPARDVVALRKLLERTAPDLVYWRFNLKGLLGAAKTCHQYGAKFVFGIAHQLDVERIPAFLWRRGPGPWLRRLRDYHGYHYVDGLISLTQELLGRAPVRHQVLIPNMMEAVTCPFEWPRPFIAWIAHLKPRKQPERFVELAARLQEERPGIDCLMVGAIQSSAYDGFRVPESTPDNLHYLGPKDPREVNGILQQSLFLVHTCAPEGFPNIFIQSWLQGKPTLSLSYDPDGVIQRERLGHYCHTLDRLVESTRQMVDDSVERQIVGERARAYAQRNHTAEVSIPKYEAFFEKVLKDSD